MALVHSGEGHWKKENSSETESGDEKRKGRVRDGAEQSAGKRFSRAQPGSPGSLRRPCLHTEKFRTISQLFFQWPLKGTDSFLVTHPVSCESGCYHGKIQTFGIRSGLPLLSSPRLRRAAPQPPSKPRVMPVKSVCA